MRFNQWLDTLVAENGIDLEDNFEIEKEGLTHIFDYGFIVEAIKQASPQEKKAIQTMLVKIDFINGDITHYFRHLAQALC